MTDPTAIECSNFFLACAFFFYFDELAKAAYYALTDEELEDILITEESLGVLGMDYDFNLHYAVGHMRCIHGALPVHLATSSRAFGHRKKCMTAGTCGRFCLRSNQPMYRMG